MGDLDRLFYWRGIAADYFNYRGEFINVPIENRINLLKSMGVDADDSTSIEQEAYRLDVEPWSHWLKNTCVEHAGTHASVEINFKPSDANSRFTWALYDGEENKVAEGSFVSEELEETGEYLYEGQRFVRRRLRLDHRAPGYYKVELFSEGLTESAVLALCPETAYAVEGRFWGVIIQLYTLRSDRNWGIGDFTDLKSLINAAQSFGAGAIGLNPLHALSPHLHDHFSPYSPSDRRFINPLYLDPETLHEFDCHTDFRIDQRLRQELNTADAVNYPLVRDLKFPLYEQLFEKFVDNEWDNDTKRAFEFKDYVQGQGSALLKFAYYEATHQEWQGAKYVFRSGLRSTELRTDFLLERHAKSFDHEDLSILFHCYLQWVSEDQLEQCQRLCEQLGMPIGLVRDLAVGADGGGAEVSTNKHLFCQQSSIGAPPDPFAQTGQNWGMPPMIPSELRKSGYRHYLELLRSNMAHCGALRIDHAMSLMRLWWCPPDKTAAHGAYVYYPFDDLLGLLNLESHLNRCMIIAEDLGVVPDEFRAAIAAAKLTTNKVFYFEKGHDNQLKVPWDYDENALAMVNNHDVPTLKSWWNGSDLSLRNSLSLLEEGVDYDDICKHRNEEKAQLMALLYENNKYPEGWHGKPIDSDADRNLIESILLYLSQVDSRLYVIQLEDLLMMEAPVNVPGTFMEYANWQRKLTKNTDEIFMDDNNKNVLSRIDRQRKNAEQ